MRREAVMEYRVAKENKGKHRFANFTLTTNQATWLESEAEKTGQTKSAIIRALIEKAASKK